MNELSQIRINLLKNAAEFAGAYAEAACGRGVMTCTDKKLREEYWSVIKELALKDAENTVQVKGLSEGTTSQRIDAVLEQVASGRLSITQGKRIMEMLQAGFEITDLQALMAKLDATQSQAS